MISLQTKTQQNLITIDVEEWWAVESFSRYINDKQIITFSDRIEEGIYPLLDLLDEHRIKSTFFVTGRVAKKNGKVIKEIHNRGHDIGSHGYKHKLIYSQTKKDFEKDLIDSLNVLENLLGIKINKYRAPSYSITKKCLWCLEVLLKNGIKIDSSIFPTKNNRFGIKNALPYPHKIYLDSLDKSIIEIPPNSIELFGLKIPVTNGFFLRAIPSFLLGFIYSALRRKNMHKMLILHSWEMDLDQPRLPVGISAKLIHYYNLKSVLKKIKNFIELHHPILTMQYFNEDFIKDSLKTIPIDYFEKN